jgi:hypothetical protein
MSTDDLAPLGCVTARIHLTHNRRHIASNAPFRIIFLEFRRITYVPDMIATPVLRHILPRHFCSGQLHPYLDCFQQRAIARSSTAHVVTHQGAGTENILQMLRQVSIMYVVAYLLASVAEHLVRRSRQRAMHKVSQEALQLRSGVIRPGKASTAKTDSTKPVNVPPVFQFNQRQ